MWQKIYRGECSLGSHTISIKGLDGNVKVESSVNVNVKVGCSINYVEKYKILKAVRRMKDKLTTLDFRRSNFCLFKGQLGRIQEDKACRDKEPKKAGSYLRSYFKWIITVLIILLSQFVINFISDFIFTVLRSLWSFSIWNIVFFFYMTLLVIRRRTMLFFFLHHRIHEMTIIKYNTSFLFSVRMILSRGNFLLCAWEDALVLKMLCYFYYNFSL